MNLRLPFSLGFIRHLVRKKYIFIINTKDCMLAIVGGLSTFASDITIVGVI